MSFPANLMTGAKHRAFSTNHLADSDKTKYNNQEQRNVSIMLRCT